MKKAFLVILLLLILGCQQAIKKDIVQDVQVCAQVITYAQNPKTNTCDEFSTPCNVPKGWKACENKVSG